jgi:hypothetical protein
MENLDILPVHSIVQFEKHYSVVLKYILLPKSEGRLLHNKCSARIPAIYTYATISLHYNQLMNTK